MNFVTYYTARLCCLVSLVMVFGWVGMFGQWPSEVLVDYRDGNLGTWITRTRVVFDQFEIQRAKGIRNGQVDRTPEFTT